MDKNLKLYSGAEAVQKFQKAGWSAVRKKGSHVMLTKPGFQWTLSYLNTVNLVLVFFASKLPSVKQVGLCFTAKGRETKEARKC